MSRVHFGGYASANARWSRSLGGQFEMRTSHIRNETLESGRLYSEEEAQMKWETSENERRGYERRKCVAMKYHAKERLAWSSV
jgi:hypothetical protein